MSKMEIEIATKATGAGAQDTQKQLQNVGREAEQAAQKLRILANIEESRQARKSSNIDDKSHFEDARVQRRLQAIRQETAATQESIPVVDRATNATRKFELSNQQAAAALRRLEHAFPGAAAAAATLTNPYLAAAFALTAMVSSAKSAADEALSIEAAVKEQLAGSLDLLTTKISALAEAQAKAASSTRQHKDAIAEQEREASGIDAVLAKRNEAEDRKLRVDNAAADAAMAKELEGVTDPAQERSIRDRFAREKRAREQQAAEGIAARVHHADWLAAREAAEAERALPGAEQGRAEAQGFAAGQSGHRTKVTEMRKALESELARAKAAPQNSLWKSRLHSATWGLLGQPWQFNRPAAEIEADLKRVREFESGFPGDQEMDADRLRQWDEHVGRLQRASKGGGRFGTRAASSQAEAAAGGQIRTFQNQADASVSERQKQIEAQKEQDRLDRELTKLMEQSNRKMQDEIQRLHGRIDSAIRRDQ